MKVVAFDEWRGGEYGDQFPRLAPRGTFTGHNMVVTEDSLLCVRPGLRAATVSGDAAAGTCWGMNYQPHTGKELLVILDDTVFTATNDADANLVFTEIDTLQAEPTDICRFEFVDPNHIYMTSPGDGVYHINLSSDTVTRIEFGDDPGTPVPAGFCLRIFENRLYVGGDEGGADPDVVRYSEQSDFSNFLLAGFFQCGVHFPAFSMHVARGRLLIGNRGGGWWSLTAAPEAGGTLRRMHDIVPDKDYGTVRDDMDRVWYWTQSADRPLNVTNGAIPDADTYANLRLDGGSVHGAFSYANRDIVFHTPTNEDAFWRSHDAWCRLLVPDTLEGPMTRFGTNLVLFYTGDSEDEVPVATFAWLQLGRNRPGRPDDVFADIADLGAADPIDAEVTTREWFDSSDSKTVQVGKILVDFVGFNYDSNEGGDDDTGSLVSFEVEVIGRDRYSNAQKVHEGGTVLSLSTALFDTQGTGRRFVVPIDAGWYASFQVRIFNIVGAKLDRVLAVVQLRAEEGGP